MGILPSDPQVPSAILRLLPLILYAFLQKAILDSLRREKYRESERWSSLIHGVCENGANGANGARKLQILTPRREDRD
jgi:hypothetical protein